MYPSCSVERRQIPSIRARQKIGWVSKAHRRSQIRHCLPPGDPLQHHHIPGFSHIGFPYGNGDVGTTVVIRQGIAFKRDKRLSILLSNLPGVQAAVVNIGGPSEQSFKVPRVYVHPTRATPVSIKFLLDSLISILRESWTLKSKSWTLTHKLSCSVWHCDYSLLHCTHWSPLACTSSQRAILEKDYVGKFLR